MAPRIIFYFDAVSPFAYIAYKVLRTDPVFKACQITFIPVFLGGIMKLCNNQPPIYITNKDKWISSQRTLWSKTFSVPMNPLPVPNFPPNTLPLLRALTPLSQPSLLKALDILWPEFFVNHTPVYEPAHIHRILSSTLSYSSSQATKEEVEQIMLQSQSKEVKDMLTKRTNEAFQEGAFGVPWFVCVNDKGEKETFWGVDHLGHVCRFLGLEKPKTAPWKAVL